MIPLTVQKWQNIACLQLFQLSLANLLTFCLGKNQETLGHEAERVSVSWITITQCGYGDSNAHVTTPVNQGGKGRTPVKEQNKTKSQPVSTQPLLTIQMCLEDHVGLKSKTYKCPVDEQQLPQPWNRASVIQNTEGHCTDKSAFFLIHFLYSFGYEESFASLTFGGPTQSLNTSRLLFQVQKKHILLKAIRTLVRYHLYTHSPTKPNCLLEFGILGSFRTVLMFSKHRLKLQYNYYNVSLNLDLGVFSHSL